jgi:heterodisulfide reductase subunit A-like polyferredoxin
MHLRDIQLRNCGKEIPHGIEFGSTNNPVIEPEHALKVRKRVEVLVIGGGVAGFSASISSARMGSSTR